MQDEGDRKSGNPLVLNPPEFQSIAGTADSSSSEVGGVRRSNGAENGIVDAAGDERVKGDVEMTAEWRKIPLRETFWSQEGPGVRKRQFTDSGIKLLNVANIEKNGTLNLSKTDRHLSKVEVESKYNLRFFRFWLDSMEFRSQITRLVTGSAQQNF